ncbi:MAG: hypothetical protein ABSG63_05830 [Spirochaetia bacterium]
MNIKFALRIVAAAAAFTMPILTSYATPLRGPSDAPAQIESVAPGAQNLAQPAATSEAPLARNPAAQTGLISDDSPGTVSDVLPVLTLQQKRDIVGIDFLMQEVESSPHSFEVGAGVMVTLQPEVPGSPTF